jgi:hypothetical protein
VGKGILREGIWPRSIAAWQIQKIAPKKKLWKKLWKKPYKPWFNPS